MEQVWVDGMDVLSVKSATAFAKQYVLQNGPLMLEMVCMPPPITPS
jgi:TPP-dependent pyruvate/acetoin dehydrogenase alpha subunit